VYEWIKDFDVAITVCDKNGIITEMNAKSCNTFASHGGAALIGTSLYDCHKPSSQDKIRELLATGKANAYTIEKNGQKKLIYQQAWYQDGEIAGLVEMSLVLPEQMPHYVRS
jgi:transcriptional regulator with PAS, ATPase and Fis domain